MNETNGTIPVSKGWQFIAMRVSGSIICPIGIASSILCLCSLWKRFRTEKQTFFVLMFVVSILDLTFNVLYLVNKWGPRLIAVITMGPVYSVSLASDLCVLTLTVERYLGLCWPALMLNLSSGKKKLIRIIGCSTIVCISSIRMQYIGDAMNTDGLIPDNFLPYWETLYMVLSIICDMILPFLFVLIILILSCKIIGVVVRRQKSRRKINYQKLAWVSEINTRKVVEDKKINFDKLAVVTNAIAEIQMNQR